MVGYRNRGLGVNKFPKRGEIYWISLDPTIGSEIKKTRPAIILSNDLSNEHSQRVIVGPITSSIDKIYPFESKVELPDGTSKVKLDQIRSVDKLRVGKKICTATLEEIRQAEKALKITLGLS